MHWFKSVWRPPLTQNCVSSVTNKQTKSSCKSRVWNSLSNPLTFAKVEFEWASWNSTVKKTKSNWFYIEISIQDIDFNFLFITNKIVKCKIYSFGLNFVLNKLLHFAKKLNYCPIFQPFALGYASNKNNLTILDSVNLYFI